VMAFFGEVEAFCKESQGDERMQPYVGPLAEGLGRLQQATMWFMNNAMAKPDNAGAGATDYMHMFGLVAMGYMWGLMAKAAAAKEGAPGMAEKLVVGRFYMERLMPETGAQLARISAGADTTMALSADAF
jgi:acyl-CoA dehydrogenase